MDTVKFIEERNRMCKSFYAACHDADLQRCHAFKVIKTELLCAVGRESTMDAASQIAIVEEWSAAQPRKTRQSVFMEQYPEAEIDEQGYLTLCPRRISADCRRRVRLCTKRLCSDCCREFWMQEVE